MEANIETAKTLFKKNKYQETINICNQILSTDSNSTDALKLLAKSFFSTRKIVEARLSLNQALNINPDDFEIIKDLGNTYQAVGDINNAKNYYQKAIAINSSYAPALTNLGNIELTTGNKQEALSLLIKATESDPQLAPAWGNLANGYIQLGKTQEAEIACRKSIELNPNLCNSYFLLGKILLGQKKLQEAEVSIRKSIDLNPNLFNSHFLLGTILIEQQKPKEAEISTRKAIELKPNFAEAHSNLGVILKDLGKLKEAELSQRKAIELKPNWQTYFLYADSIFQRNEFEIAQNILLEAKSIAIKNHQKDYTNGALKAIELAKNNLLNSQNSEIEKGARSLININKNRLILHRQREDALLDYLYGVKNRNLNNTVDARYGKGFCSQDLYFFDDKSPTISKLSDDLKRICRAALGLTEIMFFESFFNIFKSGSSSGATTHNHIGKGDTPFGLSLYKYSLIYYLEVGDQSGDNPGLLKLYEPEEEILPANNMLIIIGADRNHSVSYFGRKDRVVISANFFGFL